ncbi:MAG: lysylphosphatidylglycerol synthase transmembrane domain-containing protein [Actinomycetota bacterium]
MADQPPDRPASASDEAGSRPPRWWSVRSLVTLAVSAVALYLFAPSLLSSVSSWRELRDLVWPFAVLALALQVVSWILLFELDRIALRCDGRITVASAVLAGNAAGRIIPGSATPFSVALLRDAGVDGGQAAAGLTTSTLLQIGTALALVVLSVPTLIAGAPVDRGLLTTTYLGLAVFAVLVILGAVMLQTDGLLTWIGRAIQAALNATVRRHDRLAGLDRKLLEARDFVLGTLRSRWRSALLTAASSTLFDFVSLLASLRAVHADPRPSLVVLAYVAAEVLAQIPFTPGGLGFVEAGLVGTLTLSGVPASDAVVATLLYRLLSYWLPIPVGGIAYLLFRRRHPGRGEPRPRDPA